MQYKTVRMKNWMQIKKKWLDEHPDFNLIYREENAAKKVAQAMKAEGWRLQATHGDIRM